MTNEVSVSSRVRNSTIKYSHVPFINLTFLFANIETAITPSDTVLGFLC